jgi:hypothetical protein
VVEAGVVVGEEGEMLPALLVRLIRLLLSGRRRRTKGRGRIIIEGIRGQRRWLEVGFRLLGSPSPSVGETQF